MSHGCSPRTPPPSHAQGRGAHGMKSASMPECAFTHTCGLKCCATCSIAAVSGSLRIKHNSCQANSASSWPEMLRHLQHRRHVRRTAQACKTRLTALPYKNHLETRLYPSAPTPVREHSRGGDFEYQAPSGTRFEWLGDAVGTHRTRDISSADWTKSRHQVEAHFHAGTRD